MDLREGVKKKFKEDLDPLIIAADLLKVESLEYMPRMIQPLTLKDLQTFFQQKEKDTGLRTVK